MREYKFRGKTKNPKVNKWVYGYLADDYHISEKNELGYTYIRKETIGEYTGLKDQNGKEIYEGDVVAMQFQRACKRKKAVIKYIDKYAGFVLTETLKEKENTSLGDYQMENVEVIGNIYDNPELLEEGE